MYSSWMNTEPFGQYAIRIAYTHHTHCCRTNFFQTALRITFAGLWRASNSKEVDRVGHTNRLQHPGGIIGPPRPFSSCSALARSFSCRYKVWRSHSSYGKKT